MDLDRSKRSFISSLCSLCLSVHMNRLGLDHHGSSSASHLSAGAHVFHLYCMRGTHTHTHTHSLSCLTCSNPWISRAALKIKFLSQIIFPVIRKYTCSQREECLDAMATPMIARFPLFCFSGAVSSPLNFSVSLLLDTDLQ